jgi:hypothetical protein
MCGPGLRPSARCVPRKRTLVGMRRLDSRSVGVTVDASPAGRVTKKTRVAFPRKESDALRASFLSIIKNGKFRGGRAQITVPEASKIGDRLVQVMFPPPVFRLFATSLASVVANGGLRLRLAMDPELLDLPWDYVSRPDRQVDGKCHVSNFLLLDPSISMVRHAADPGGASQPDCVDDARTGGLTVNARSETQCRLRQFSDAE